MSDTMMLRVGMIVFFVVLVAGIVLFGRPKKHKKSRRMEQNDRVSSRIEPSLGGLEEHSEAAPVESTSDEAITQPDLELEIPKEIAGSGDELGRREQTDFDKIITLYVSAKPGKTLRGEDIVVAAEKTGLIFGHKKIFHRLVERQPRKGPVFSMANIMQPGSFDIEEIRGLQTHAIAFFMTLPGPLKALEAWEMMLPNAQRMAELLDGMLLDDSRNALGRQRIQHIREELRIYDRQQETELMDKTTQW